LGFFNSYKAVFDAVRSVVQTKSNIKTVVFGDMVEAKARDGATDKSLLPVMVISLASKEKEPFEKSSHSLVDCIPNLSISLSSFGLTRNYKHKDSQWNYASIIRKEVKNK